MLTASAACRERDSRAVANRSIAAPRSAGAQFAHPVGSENASRAAETARSTSAVEAAATESTSWPVLADRTGILESEEGVVQLPPMYSESLPCGMGHSSLSVVNHVSKSARPFAL
jgi:hypothetical protein